ncbi:MAG: peptidylprolyl isomerase [Planctomycetota bacterium]
MMVGEAPTIAAIEPTTVELGNPLHLAIDGADADGGPLRVDVAIADPAILEATVLEGNRSWRLEVDGYDDLLFELFEQRAPRPTARIIELTEAGFYDGILFHRIIDGFVLQGGDPDGDGTGGSDLGNFDDQFHSDLQHSSAGVLSFAKAFDDGNDSQFFVTDTATPFLDFNHSVFGVQVEGSAARVAMSEVAVDADDKPLQDVRISRATIVEDEENSVIMLRALSDTGTTEVTVTITDEDDNSTSETFVVTLDTDGYNQQPFLAEPSQFGVPTAIPSGIETQFQLMSEDIEGDAVRYLLAEDTANSVGSVDVATGVVSLTPNQDYEGSLTTFVGVAPEVSFNNTDFDSQALSVTVYNGFHNPEDRFNVNGLNDVTSLDALIIINAINEAGGNIVISPDVPEFLRSDYDYDVSADQQISSLDALQIINEINRRDAVAVSESITDAVLAAAEFEIGFPSDERSEAMDHLAQNGPARLF